MNRAIALCAALLLLACSSGDSNKNNGSPGGSDSDATTSQTDGSGDTGLSDPGGSTPAASYGIAILGPPAEAPFTGSIELDVVPLPPNTELKLDRLEVFAGGTSILIDTKIPTHLVLDTRTYPDGKLVLKAVAETGGERAEATMERDVVNPEYRLVEVDMDRDGYASGSVITLVVTLNHGGAELSADFSGLDSGYVPGAERSYALSTLKHVIAYTISTDNTRSDGVYQVPITARFGSHTIVNTQTSVLLMNLPAMPLELPRCIFVPEALPVPDGRWTQGTPTIDGSSTIITGGSAHVDIDFSHLSFPQDVVGVVIGVAQHSGYCNVPVHDSTGLEEIIMLMRTYRESETMPKEVRLQVSLRDARGAVAPYVTHTMKVQPVGSGDVQVSISWDTETDVDLHVIDPYNCEMYFAHKTCESGGELDLDSNPGCNLDHINNENVFWSRGAAPKGEYIVRVDFYKDCGDPDGYGANYVVTMNYCGEAQVVEGFLPPDTDDQGGAGSGIEVGRFDITRCQNVARGRVRYEDRAFDRWGFAARGWKPVRYATVELRRLSDDEVLGTSRTGRDGRYQVQFANDGPPGVYLVVKSTANLEEGSRRIEVRNHPKFQEIYEASSPPVFENEHDDEFIEIDLDITETLSSGAFNIFDVVINGHDRVRRMTGRDLEPLVVFWATGADTTDTLYCSSFFYDQGTCSVRRALSVQGKDTDRDEYDDMVIGKEFFKFVLETVARDDNPGGTFDGTRDDPTRAWTEGVTTFFACDAARTHYFVNSRPQGVYLVDDVEGMSNPFSYGTDGSAIDGALSPMLVSALLWDLADTRTEEGHDQIDDMTHAIYDVVFNYLGSEHYVDRGYPGVDLTDFLDGWFCRGWGNQSAIEALANGHRKLFYDFGGPETCGR
jgi:hypothetical protein